jgi:hypothetical protein
MFAVAMEPITIQAQVSTLPIHLQAIVTTAIYKQFDIGWNNALRSLLSQQWAQSAASHPTTEHYKLDQGNGHIYRTIQALHTFTTTEIWDSRNS